MMFGNLLTRGRRLARARFAQAAATTSLLEEIAAECRETDGSGPGFEKMGPRCKTCPQFTGDGCILRNRRVA